LGSEPILLPADYKIQKKSSGRGFLEKESPFFVARGGGGGKTWVKDGRGSERQQAEAATREEDGEEPAPGKR